MNQSSVTSLRRRLRFRPLFPAVIFSLSLSLCHAQTAGTGAISGTITDPSGAVVTNATIKAIDQTTGETRTAASSGGGAFQVPLLRPSTYRVEVSKGGFKQWVSEGVPVQITETVTLAVHLELGAPLETVEVSAASNLLTTEDSTLGNVVNERAVNSLPLVTRNYQQILGLSSGVAAEVFNAGEIGRGGVDSNVVTGGGVASDNNFQMNGVEINDLQGSGHFSGGVAAPNPDSIQEFKVQTSQYDASFGRNAGANVNVLTKSGSNRWHGSAWEYFRNEALNANDYFRKQTNEPRAILRQNQFGFALGGPVINSKLLFFTSYQGTRQQNGIDQNCSASDILPVLTDDRSPAALAAAVGPDTAFLGLDPLGRPVDATNVSPQAVALFSLKLANGNFLIPNPQQIITDPATGLPEGFSTFSSPCRYYEDQFVTNFDFLHTTKSTLQGRFFFSNSEANFTLPSARVAGSGSLPGSPSRNPQNFRNFSLTHTYLFNGNLVNQAEVGFHRTLAGTDQKFPFSYSGIGSSVPAFDDARPVIIVAGGFSVGGDGQTVVLAQNSYVFQDTLSWIHGRHSLRFGGGITRAQDNMSQFQFAGYSIFINYPGLMLGQAPFNPFVTQDLAGITQRHWRVWDGNLYAQDDIKVTRSLTLNLGFRYERLGDFGEINGRNASMDPSLIDRNPPDAGTLAGVVVSDNFPGTAPPGVTKSGNNLGIKGVGQNTMNPRVGFAWVLPGTNRLVMRGGYGVYHQRATGQPYLQQISNQPFGQIRLVQPAFNGSFANPLPPDPGPFPQFFPYSPTSELLSPQIIDPKVRPPIFQRYSLNLQSQLARDLVLQVGYTGMRGTHLLTWHTINQADLATPDHPIRGETTTTLTNLQLRVPYQGFSAGSMFDVQSNGIAWYNALEASLSKRLSHGLQFLASYTFSRDLANVFESTIGPNGGQVYGDNNDPRSNYGPDAFVRPHRFVFSGVYDLPGPRNSHSLAGQILGNWKLAGVLTAQSGHLLPVLTSTGTNAFGIPTDFAQLIPGCKLSTSGSVQNRLNNWINQDCVDPAGPAYVGDPDPPGTCADPNPQGVCARAFGNSRMGILRGPGQFNTDLSISKLFRLTERANLEFRTEFFNAFNNAVFADPDNTVTDVGSFGHITSTVSNPRVMQFAFKLSF
jgi:hypothetical protein